MRGAMGSFLFIGMTIWLFVDVGFREKNGAPLTLLGPQSRFGGKSLGIRMVCPQIGTAVLLRFSEESLRKFRVNLHRILNASEVGAGAEEYIHRSHPGNSMRLDHADHNGSHPVTSTTLNHSRSGIIDLSASEYLDHELGMI